MNDVERTELRLFAMGAQHLIPLLEKKKEYALGELMQKFTANEGTERALAKLCALHELEADMRGKLRTFENLEQE